MPDYSGYAQRPNQDPNLAAWGQISGNLANIFGLDPAKAAEARRGLQQEDYNEQRNKAYMRQIAANKRIGELFAGKGYDSSRGEFSDAASWQEFAQLMGEMGNGHQAAAYGPGHYQSQLNARIEAENRAYDKRKELSDAEIAARDKRATQSKEDMEQARLGRGHAGLLAFGNKGRGYNSEIALNRFDYLLGSGDASKGIKALTSGWVEPSPDTKDLPRDKQKLVATNALKDWMDEAGYKQTSLHPDQFNAMGDSTALIAHTADRIGGTLGIPGNSPVALDLAKRLLIHQFGDTSPSLQTGDVAVSSLDELNKAIVAASQPNGPKRIVARYPVMGPDGQTKFVYGEYNPSNLLHEKNKEIFGRNHPALRYAEGR